jgi:hypothetical protein
MSVSDSQQGWTTVGDMPKPLCNVGLLVCENNILLFGGVSFNETQSDIYQLDPVSF